MILNEDRWHENNKRMTVKVYIERKKEPGMMKFEGMKIKSWQFPVKFQP